MKSIWDFLGIDPGIFQNSLDMEKANTGQFPDYIEVGQLDLKIFGMPIVVNPKLRPGEFELRTYPENQKEAVNG